MSDATSDAPDTATLEVGGLSFDALVAGPEDGRLVFLLHGFPQTADCWRPYLGALAGAGYRVVAPDQRGYSAGARPGGVASYRLDRLTGDVLGMADALGADGFDVVGHDWGGAVAWALAAAPATRVRSIVSVSTPHPGALLDALPRSLQVLQSSYILLFRTPVVSEALLGARGAAPLAAVLRRSGLDGETAARYRDAMAQPGALSAALSWYRAMGPGTARAIGRVAVPTTYVWGRRDPALGRTAAERTAGWVDGRYRFVELDAGHWIPENHVGELRPLLLEHLATS